MFFALSSFCPFYTAGLEDEVSKYSGDGFIEDISRCSFFIPFDGYRITFEKFSLKKAYSVNYKLENIPTKCPYPAVNLLLADSHSWTKEEIQELSAKLNLHMLGEDGSEVFKKTLHLKDLYWNKNFVRTGFVKEENAFNMYQLYSFGTKSDQHLRPIIKEGRAYNLLVSFEPDLNLTTAVGFIEVACGGSK